jgi:hypothetical protein
MHRSWKLVFLAFTATACISLSPTLRRETVANREKLNHVHVGQTIAEVRQVMGKEPERRDVRQRFDGKMVEMWSYATDYVRRLDTTIVFIDGKVQEIKTLPWYEPD